MVEGASAQIAMIKFQLNEEDIPIHLYELGKHGTLDRGVGTDRREAIPGHQIDLSPHVVPPALPVAENQTEQ
jgi:hypothetical protein